MIDDYELRRAFTNRHTDQAGVTLVAFYDEGMPVELASLISSIHRQIMTSLPDESLFTPYPLKQVHGTIIGLEGARNSQGQIILENMKNRKRPEGSAIPPFCIDGFLEYFHRATWPISLRFGGYRPSDRNPYDANRQPWNRSFEIRKDGLAVLMGWPMIESQTPFSPHLLGVRKYLESFGAVHKYHLHPQEQDNDLFIVIGEIHASAWARLSAAARNEALAKLQEAQDAVRRSMTHTAILAMIRAENLWVVKYRRTTLETIDFAKQILTISRTDLEGLYS